MLTSRPDPALPMSIPPNLLDALNRDRPEKARAILAGALQVFTTRGYSGASMDRIAAAAGVSKTTMYSYFQDKERLFVALIQDLTAANRQIVFGFLTSSDLGGPPDQVLRQMARLVVDNFAANQPLLTLIRLVIGESERFPELGKTFVREVQKPMLEQLTLYLAAQPQLNLPDPMVAARVFAGTLVHYFLVQSLMHGDEIIPIERDRLVDGLVDILTAGDRLKS